MNKFPAKTSEVLKLVRASSSLNCEMPGRLLQSQNLMNEGSANGR